MIPSLMLNSGPGNVPGCTYPKVDSLSMSWLCSDPASLVRWPECAETEPPPRCALPNVL